MTRWIIPAIIYGMIGVGCMAQVKLIKPDLDDTAIMFAGVAWPAFVGMGLVRAVYALPATPQETRP
jgi:hypothetical protein